MLVSWVIFETHSNLKHLFFWTRWEFWSLLGAIVDAICIWHFVKNPVGATDEICIGSGDVDGDGSEF